MNAAAHTVSTEFAFAANTAVRSTLSATVAALASVAVYAHRFLGEFAERAINEQFVSSNDVTFEIDAAHGLFVTLVARTTDGTRGRSFLLMTQAEAA